MTENTIPEAAEDREVACPACGFQNASTNNYCEKCGEDLQEQNRLQRLLDTDPELVALNEKYANQGVKRSISGLVVLISGFVFHQWLEYDRFEFLSTFALLTLPVALIVFFIYCCKRGITRKKIEKKLEEVSGGKRGN